MKRFHVHVGVSNLEKSTQFYSAMFGMQPTVKKDDYAKWMLEDPRVNFAISQRGGEPGINHLGFQAENEAEVGANCCYAKSDKYWVQDPSGLAWESFRSLDTIPFYGDDNPQSADKNEGAGCATSCCPTPAVSQSPATKACCNG
jgi:catechol 2,3-dioxygenase-like lactoylglutathione lyase family enzyme